MQSLQRSLIEQLSNRPLGPSAPSQDVTSPVDSTLGVRNFGSGFNIETTSAEPSRLEDDFAKRLLQWAPEFSQPNLRQFGYELLGDLVPIVPFSTGGAINGNYVLGIGDELVITFRGQVNNSYRTAVDREGQVILPDLPPVPAAGLTFKQFRAELKRRTGALFTQTEAFASLGKVRNFAVMVVGQVRRPGVHRVTGIASILDALISAGGIQKSGSLRRVQLVRQGRTIVVDLYDLLLTGKLKEDISLREGDRVFVPSIGNTIGIVGEVQRPGIYELAGRKSQLTVAGALALTGGTLRSKGYRHLLMTTERDGGDAVREVTEPARTAIAPGDVVMVSKIGYGWRGAFFLDGHVAVPGPRSLQRHATIASVLRDKQIYLQNPYTLFAVLDRTDPKTRARHFLGVNLESIMAGRSDARLQSNDRLIILSMDDVRFLSSERVQAILQGRTARRTSILDPEPDQRLTTDRTSASINRTGQVSSALSNGNRTDAADDDPSGFAVASCRALAALADVISRSRSGRYAGAVLSINPERIDAVPSDRSCPPTYDRFPHALPFILDFAVAINGEVRVPGLYPVARNTALANLLPVVGGMGQDADLSQIEVTRFDPRITTQKIHQTVNARKVSLLKVALNPGDIVRFNPVFSPRDIGSVFLSGEFKRPGVYYIRRGEKFSDLITRAGGLTDQAYSLGAVFTRVRVRAAEKKSFERAAFDLQSGLAEALASGAARRSDSDPGAMVLAVRELANTLRNTEPVGRVVFEADPNVLRVQPEVDTVLEAGDQIHVPKRPNHVTVSGEVLNPGAIQFRAGKAVDQYLKAAGGVSRVADDGRIFVVYPNGEAQPVSVSSWNFTSIQIPPGSTIIIPRDPKPFDLTSFTVSIADILSKLAISAASIAVIGRN